MKLTNPQSYSSIILLIILGLFSVVPAYAQQDIDFKGKIIDDFGEPLIGVNIRINGTKEGTASDIDGNFKLLVKPNSVLTITYMGY